MITCGSNEKSNTNGITCIRPCEAILKRGIIRGSKEYRRVYRLSWMLQKAMWKLGVNWHNCIADECTPGFECCIEQATPEWREVLSGIAVAANAGQEVIHVNPPKGN